MLRFKLFVLLTAVFLTFGVTAQAEDDFYELSISTMYTPGQAQFKDVFEAFAKDVEEKTNGSLVINIFGTGTIVGPFEEAHAVKSGNIDAGPLLSLVISEVVNTSVLQLVPDLAQSMEDTVRIGPVLYNNLPEIKEETDFYGIPFGFTSTVPQMLISNNKLIKTPADLKGRRMLVMGNAHAIIAEAWGAIPVMVGMSDIYIGLQRGMGEVVLAGSSWIKGAKLYETAKYITVVNYPNTTYIPYIINKELFEELSENQQNIFMESAEEHFGEIWLQSWKKDHALALTLFEEAGCEIYYPTAEESLQWQEANKRAIPLSLDRAEAVGLSREDGLEFLNRTYDVLEANGFKVNRYTGE